MKAQILSKEQCIEIARTVMKGSEPDSEMGLLGYLPSYLFGGVFEVKKIDYSVYVYDEFVEGAWAVPPYFIKWIA